MKLQAAVCTVCLLVVASVDAFSVTPPVAPPAIEIVAPATTATATLSSSNLLAAAASTATTTTTTAAPPTTTSSTTKAVTPSVPVQSAASAPAASAPAVNSSTKTNGVGISSIFYDGKVPTTEADEYVVLTNYGKSPVEISGYYVYVATTGTQGPTFTFPKNSNLGAGKSVRIYTNEIHKETGGYNFASNKAIWNNRGGVAVVRDAGGKKLGELKY